MRKKNSRKSFVHNMLFRYMNDVDKKGFSLIELLVTIAVIGILAGVAATAYVGTAKKAARSEAYSNLDSLRLLEESFFADNGDYAPTAPFAWGVAAIQANLPLFKPGSDALFWYGLVKNYELDGTGGNTTANPPGFVVSADTCFLALSKGLAGTRVEGDYFAIDCNNERNY